MAARDFCYFSNYLGVYLGKMKKTGFDNLSKPVDFAVVEVVGIEPATS